MRRGDHNNITEPEEGSDKFYHSATKRFNSVMQFCKLSPMPLATTPYSKQGWISDLLTCSKLHQGVKRLSLTIMPIDILFSRRCEQCENSIQERLSSI